VPVAVPARQLS
jgi:hypothetical protein